MKEKIRELMAQNSHAVVAIDGMAAAGKSTFAAELACEFDGEVIHMDDFFLPMELRTAKRLGEAGGNVHYERFAEEVSANIKKKKSFDYGIFDCSRMMIGGWRHIENNGLLIIEGAYCLRPEFRSLYDFKIFMKIDRKTQIERILKRDGRQKAEMFKEKWIPMEEAYFKAMDVERSADFVVY